MLIEAPVADWEEWTAMRLPADGDYVVPGMLAPLEVRDGVGVHVEPNVWLATLGSQPFTELSPPLNRPATRNRAVSAANLLPWRSRSRRTAATTR